MRIPMFARVAGITLVAAGLSACVDIDMAIDITSTSTATGTVTMTMDRQMYDMALASDPNSDFCPDGEVTVAETTVTCVSITEGDFSKFSSENPDEPSVTALPGNQVRVAFPLGSAADQLGAGMGEMMPAEASTPEQQAQMMAMMSALFEGKSMTITVTGGAIVDTNMELAADGNSATYTALFTDLLSPDNTLPEEIYAVVQK